MAQSCEMEPIDRAAIIPIGILLIVVLSAWLGIAGAALSDISAKGIYVVAKDWQTLIAGLLAIAAAWWTVRAMRRQTDAIRTDQAQRDLDDYAIAIANVLQKYESIKNHMTMPASLDSLKIALDQALDHPTASAAGIADVLGNDQKMVRMFANCCRFSALAIFNNRREPHEERMIWPLYIMISDGLNARKRMLREGCVPSDLFSISTIDHDEVNRAYAEQRSPRLLS